MTFHPLYAFVLFRRADAHLACELLFWTFRVLPRTRPQYHKPPMWETERRAVGRHRYKSLILLL
jgi:hypothetical protein